MKTKDIKKGISLIVLIITIIVVIILAAVVILTLSKNNPIESAKEARFKEDVRTFQDELALAVSKEYASAGGHRDEKISTSNFDEIKEYIPSFSEKYRDKFVIKDDELVCTTKLDEKEKEYAQRININESKGLPKEYQQVEYIESTGTQYIDTEYYSCNNEEIELKVLFNVVFNGRTGDFSFMGGMENSSTTFWDFWYVDGYGELQYYAARNSSPRRTSLDPVIKKNTEYVLKSVLNNNIYTAYYNGVSLGSIDEISNNVSPNSLWLFADFSGRYNKMQGKIYYCKILSNNKLIKNFIPCYRISDNVVGMFDTVEGKFYTNQGTGEFIAGPDVNE